MRRERAARNLQPYSVATGARRWMDEPNVFEAKRCRSSFSATGSVPAFTHCAQGLTLILRVTAYGEICYFLLGK